MFKGYGFYIKTVLHFRLTAGHSMCIMGNLPLTFAEEAEVGGGVRWSWKPAAEADRTPMQ